MSQYNWFINWKILFGNIKQNSCKVRCKLISNSNSNISNQFQIGTVRANFSSNTSNMSNGFILGSLNLTKLNFDTYNPYFFCDTSDSVGTSIIIPKEEISQLNIYFYDISENLITTPINFQVYLYFDTE